MSVEAASEVGTGVPDDPGPEATTVADQDDTRTFHLALNENLGDHDQGDEATEKGRP